MIEETIKKLNERRNRADNEKKLQKEKAQKIETIFNFITQSLVNVAKDVTQNRYAVSVDFPKKQEIVGKVSVEGLTSLLHAINELKVVAKNSKLELPDIQKIFGEVKVVNFPEPKKLPEYPKQIKSEITALPKYVSEKLDRISKEIAKIEVKPEVLVENKTPEVVVDLSSIKNGLKSIVEEIRRIPQPEKTEIDLSEVVSTNKETTKAIKSLSFPVPNFKSSWSHSLTMRAEDLGKTFTYATDGNKKVVQSITVEDVDGGKYKKTYTYSGDGSEMPTTESKWERIS